MYKSNPTKKTILSPFVWICIAALALLASACGGGEETVSPETRFTEAAQTAQVRSTELFGQTPTLDPANMVASVAAPTPTPTIPPATAPITPTLAATTPAAVAPPPSSGGPDAATYVSDVTVPDDTVFAPGDTFDKVWRIRNTGTTTWSTEYSLVFIDGDTLGAPANVPIPNEVSPGEEVEVTVEMTAPETAGSYISYWKMSTPDGGVFGFGVAGNEAIWAKISVQAGAAMITPAAPGPAPVVSAVSLSVDEASAVTCPHTFLFTGQITLTKPASVTYLLEVGDQSGNSVKGPPPATQNLSAGQHPVVYELTIPAEIAGWAQLRVTSPVDLESNQVAISLACG